MVNYKLVLVFKPRGRGITNIHTPQLVSVQWEGLNEGVWWSLLSSVLDVSNTLLSQLENILTNLCLKISEQGMSSAISLYFSFILCSFPLQE